MAEGLDAREESNEWSVRVCIHFFERVCVFFVCVVEKMCDREYREKREQSRDQVRKKKRGKTNVHANEWWTSKWMDR